MADVPEGGFGAILQHGTAPDAVTAIQREGLDWNRAQQGVYGQGVYVADAEAGSAILSAYGEGRVPVAVRLWNPLMLRTREEYAALPEGKAARDRWIRQRGHDGVLAFDTQGRVMMASVLDPEAVRAVADAPRATAPERLAIKPEGAKLTKAQATAAANRVVRDMARHFGYSGNLPEIDIRAAGQVEPGFEAGLRNGRIVVTERWLEDATSRDVGVSPFRQIAHEAVHAMVSGTEVVRGQNSRMAEEYGAEFLSIDYWNRRGQPYDQRDGVRRGGRWDHSLAPTSVYNAEVAEGMRRAASRVGWNRDAIRAEAERVMRGDHNVRLEFRDTTDPNFAPPEGYPADGENLLRWYLGEPAGPARDPEPPAPAAPAVEYGPAPRPVHPPPAPAPAPPSETPPLRAAFDAGYEVIDDLRGGNRAAGVQRVRLSNGQVAVLKTMEDSGLSYAAQEHASEIAAANVLDALGVTSLPTVDAGPDPEGRPRTLTPFVEGETAIGRLNAVHRQGMRQEGDRAGMTYSQREKAANKDVQAAEAELARQPNGREIGILDFLIGNADRHHGNWLLRPDGSIAPIDHGGAKISGGYYTDAWVAGTPFVDEWTGIKASRRSDRVTLKPKVSRAYLDAARAALEARRAQFSDEQWAFLQARLGELAARAPRTIPNERPFGDTGP